MVVDHGGEHESTFTQECEEFGIDVRITLGEFWNNVVYEWRIKGNSKPKSRIITAPKRYVRTAKENGEVVQPLWRIIIPGHVEPHKLERTEQTLQPHLGLLYKSR